MDTRIVTPRMLAISYPIKSLGVDILIAIVSRDILLLSACRFFQKENLS